VFTGDVVNNGTFKTTNANVTFAGTYTENGVYISDPSDNYFVGDYIIGASGYLVGGVGDNWHISGNFINNSLQDGLWNTDQASLLFEGVGSQDLFLAGSDIGGINTGYIDNFSWGEFHVNSGVSLNIFDGNSTAGAALYVGLIDLADSVDLNTLYIDYILSDYNIYYDPTLAGNSYLQGLTFSLNGVGSLIATSAVPIPPAAWLFGSGLFGLIGIARRKVGNGTRS
jgi:hypothetical protein